MRLSLTLIWAGVLVTLLSLTTGCTAPGKPLGEETTADQVTDFPTLYATNCAGCHGNDGKNGPGRILNDSLYLSFIPKGELKNVLVYGRAGTAMPAWSKAHGGSLTDKQIDVLVEGIYSNWARPFDSGGVPVPAYASALDGADIAHGKKLFTRNCYGCHAQGGLVGPVTTPTYLQLVSNQMLRTSIVVGRTDLGMPNYLHLNAGKALSNSDVTDLVAYLTSLRTVPAPGGSPYTNDKGTGESGVITTGNAGSGNGPGAPIDNRNEGSKHSNSSQSGGTIEAPSANKSRETHK